MKRNIEIVENLSTSDNNDVKHYLLSDGSHRLVVQAGGSEQAKDSVKNGLTSMWGFNGFGDAGFDADTYRVRAGRYTNNIAFGINLVHIAATAIIKNLTLTLTEMSGGKGDCGIAPLDITNYKRGDQIAAFGNCVNDTVSVDITPAIESAQQGVAYFCIYGLDSNTDRTFISSDNPNESKRPYLTIDYIPQGEILQGQKYLECFAGSSISCNIDILNGVPYIKNNLLSLGGEKIPLSLSMRFNATNNAEFILNLDTGLGQCWYTNYHQFCYKPTEDSSVYYYTDNNGIKHLFSPAINSNSLWVDTQGTGLLLEEINGGIKIYDELGNYFLFDTYGRLIEIAVKQTEAEYFINKITYVNDSSAQIKSITDGMGRVAAFTYTNTQANISLDGKNKVTIVKSSNILKLIKKLGESAGDETSTYTTDLNGITEITAASGDKITLEYYNIGEIKSVYSTQSKLKQTFNYGYFSTEITSNKGITEVFYFNEEGEFISSYEKKDDEEKSLRFVSRDALVRCAGALSEKKIAEFTFDSFGKTTYTFSNVTSNQSVTSRSEIISNNDVKNYAVFSAMLEVTEGYTESGDTSVPVVVQLIDSYEKVVCELKFSPFVSGVQFAAAPFIILRSASSASYGTVNVKLCVNSRGKEYKFSNICITPNTKGVETLCCATDTGSGTFEVSNADNLYYVNKNEKIVEGSKTYDYPLYIEDYLANERNLFTKSGNTWNMWVDKKRKLIAGVENPAVYFDGGRRLDFAPSSSLKFTVLTVDEITADATVQSYYSTDQIALDTGKKSVSRQSVISYSKLNVYTKAELTFIQYGYCDSLYRLVKQQDDKAVVQNIYSDEGFLTETRSCFATDLSQNIISRNIYENGYLTESKNYLLSTVATDKYSYDNNGNVEKFTRPNAFEIDYSYNQYGDNLTEVKGTVDGLQNKNTITYNSEKVDGMSHNGFGYVFGYDKYNNVNSIKIQNVVYATMQFDYTDNLDTAKITYGNGVVINNTFDKYGRLIKTGDGTKFAEYYYSDNAQNAYSAASPDSKDLKVSSQSKLYKINDKYTSALTQFAYDAYGNLTQITETIGNHISESAYAYDERLRLKTEEYYTRDYSIPRREFLKIEYEYRTGNNANADEVKGSISTSFDNVIKTAIEKDALERLQSISVDIGGNKGLLKEYTYCARNATEGTDAGTTAYLATEMYKQIDGTTKTEFRSDTYGYDINRNIAKISRSVSGSSADVEITEYSYDSANRLVRENNPFFNKTYTYEYDAGGNITVKNEYAYTTGELDTEPKVYNYQYTSEFKDRLSSWNGQDITYDNCGNPTKYKGNSLTWTRGRLLAQYVKGSTRYSFTYDGNGIRKSKTSADYKTEYIYSQGKLVGEYKTRTTMASIPAYLYYIYDCTGIAGVNYVNVEGRESYYFVKNSLGDIIQIRKLKDNSLVAYYEYDAWGNCKVFNAYGREDTSESFIGNMNPFRYRGYYYDTDLNLYYLQTRYYDPEIGRFVNLDKLAYLDPETINGLNLYAYCLNNPVMGVDPDGTAPWWYWLASVVIAAISIAVTVATAGAAVAVAATVAGATIGLVSGITNAVSNGEDLVEGAFRGMLSGITMTNFAMAGGSLVSGGAFQAGFFLSATGGVLGGVIDETGSQLSNGNTINLDRIVERGAQNAISNVIGTYVGAWFGGIAGTAFVPAEDAILGYIISLTSLAFDTAINALKQQLKILGR